MGKTAPAEGELVQRRGADLWKKFKEDYGISFHGQDEDDKRFAVFMSNVDLIHEANEKNWGFELGINQFAHLSTEEFSAQYAGVKMPENLWGDLPYLVRLGRLDLERHGDSREGSGTLWLWLGLRLHW